ncbi:MULTISPECIES: M28 family peptidase [unclassified Paenibacillus]|uniref:M28 family peptidase n=1 Tax=unclassified Paenibacillus TaxID=185978 RepID=UPI002407750E|nr:MULTISPECIES: M28 family peptidase [unclassified Paenibacillus]MDF9839404.1 hypothetical protein [Paenibacillus sp. PastF-2]MDF9845984.1 hypothetical protein [Paenibacillus sp. PastM-2]MDF9852557.1 hypothetical protein [Paenibacillus sp. PastF-1]MDH6477713.1 hypothetical protein [Paenibacillus sp. PastH-2]MDH6505452.1 hypothetical protein [Paenibacillus sp. PastM-3]
MGDASKNGLEQELLSEVSEVNLMGFTAQVAREVRLSGSEEEYRAFEYVKETLEGFGLSTELLESDAFISLPGVAALEINGKAYTCITHSMAQPTGDQGITGELVYIGHGMPQDYAQEDVQGKIVLLDGLAVPAVVKIAQAHGALGAVFINAAYTHEMIVSPVWGNPIPETAGLLPQLPVVSINYADGESVKSALENGKTGSAWMKTEMDTGWRKIPTLIAEIEGSHEPEKFVMFSGHIDSWHYGAMDNGSANATMLEVARILSRHRGALRRSLRLAFWSGHSHGRYAGSAWYCDTHWEDLHENCVLHINVDSVGGKGNDILTEANCMAETKDLAAGPIAVVADQEFEGARFGRAGDQSFLGTGTPSLFMGLSEAERSNEPASQAFSLLFGSGRAGGFGWWWHTTEDTLDKIDPVNLVRDCKVYVLTVYRACANALVPVNQLAAAEEIKGHLLSYQHTAEDRLDLSESLARVDRLIGNIAELQSFILKNELSETQITLINDNNMELSRLLVPLNYVGGSIFDHDLAMKAAPIPALAEVYQLAETDMGSDSYYQYRTLLGRRVNRINYTLLQASRGVEELLGRIAQF